MKPPPLNKTLVIQPLPGIGDMVWFFPHLRALAAQSPDGKVSLLEKSSSQVHHLLGHESLLDEVNCSMSWVEDSGAFRSRLCP